MRFSLGDSAGFSLMVGLGENYFSAFALALGMGVVAAGLVTPVPMLLGAVMQLVTPWAVRRIGSHKRWAVACASAQAASLFLMPVAAYFGPPAAWLVYLAATIYWGAALATAPAWNTWVETIIPRRVRTRFFAQRARVGQACIFLGIVLGGLVLAFCQLISQGNATAWVLGGFSLIFLIASAGRFYSAACLARQREPAAGRIFERRVTLEEFAGRLRRDSGARLVVYLLTVQVAVQISGPFFAPYMLGKSHLNLSYLQFMVLIGLGFIGKVFAIPAWGRLAHHAGPRRLLWAGGLAIIPVSGLWVFADWFSRFDASYSVASGWLAGSWNFSGVFVWLALVQIVSGLAWAAYELALLLMFFETIEREERTSLLTIYNLFNQIAWVIGALIGAACLRLFGEGHVAYLFVFGLSTVARLATVALLLRVREASPVVVASPAANAPVLLSGGPALAGSMQSPDAP
jgi:MFS family permease